MIFFKKKCRFEKALSLLSKNGFTREYTDMLKIELKEAERPQDIAKGKSFLANALLIQGDLKEAYQTFNEINLKKLDSSLHGNLISNMIFCLYVQNKFKDAEELYQKHNVAVLNEHSDASRRSLAIHQHINENYEASIEILANMLDSECRFLDICMVKSMLRLDMYERAAEFTRFFSRYENCGELTKEIHKLKNKVFDGLPPKLKAQYIKNNGKG
ncbi:MAG: hypothetical protein IJC04_10155 [Oscillospiraceae bacterium]|nr:hypothetical protein [Oscillospiraceae bacterium]